MKKIVFFLFLSLSTFLSAQKELRNIDSKLDSIFNHYNTGLKPGVSLAIIEKDKPIFHKSYGYANLEYQIKNTSNTLFNATDLAKQFTVFSILILQEQGKLSIDDDIKIYLPELSELSFEITIKHLMEQTSGLRDVMELKKWQGYQNGDVLTKNDILDISAKQKYLHFPSGSKFEYNRTGFVLLTEVIAKVSGMPFPEFVNQHIFKPLEMSNSVFVNSHTELIQNRSYSYATKDDKFVKIVNNSSFVGGTNLFTSASDFAKWLRNMSNQSIGKPAFYKYIHTKIELPNGQKSNYTPGIFKDNANGYWRIHLEGFDHGYTSYMLHLPEHNFSMIFFVNDINFSIDDIYDSIFDWFNIDYSIPLIKPSVAQSVEFVHKPIKQQLKYIGNYLFEDTYGTSKVVLENDSLFYVRDENNRYQTIPIKGNETFKVMVPGNDNVRFTFKNKGELLEFRVINNAKGYKDYVSLGRKFEFRDENQKTFLGEFWNEALRHNITLKSKNKKMQLAMDGISILLDQIGDNEFLARGNLKVKYLKLKRDEQQNIIGICISNGQIRNLYYKMISK